MLCDSQVGNENSFVCIEIRSQRFCKCYIQHSNGKKKRKWIAEGRWNVLRKRFDNVSTKWHTE